MRLGCVRSERGRNYATGKPPSQLLEDYLSVLTPKLKSRIEVEELVEEEVVEASLHR